MKKQKLICVAGPTASGKTALAIALAQSLGGEIISADSMQIYKGMDIGTAKPTLAERGGIPHHMIDIISPDESYSVARYIDDAARAIDGVIGRERLPILTGGTGMYIDSLINGAEFAAFEEDMTYRRELFALAEREGAQAVHTLLQSTDPDRAAQIHPNNVKRVIRALEVYKTTGKTITEHERNTKKGDTRYDVCYIGLMCANREQLYKRIDARVDKMLQDGLQSEVSGLLDSGIPLDSTAMQAIGYKEMVGVCRGETPLSQATDSIKQATRRYAKRQMTWFNRNRGIHWIDIGKMENFSDILQDSSAFIKSCDI